jgi:hypothetical protein
MKTARLRRGLVLSSFVGVGSCFGILFGSIAAIGQEISPLPDAPQPTQSRYYQPSHDQKGWQYEPNEDRTVWTIPDYRINSLTCSCLFTVPFLSLAQNNDNTPPTPPQSTTTPPPGNPAAPSLQDLGISPDQAQGNAQDQARLDKRSHMLKIHQRLGLIAAAPLFASVITGTFAGGKSTSSADRYTHLALGSAAGDLYFMSAYYAIRAPKIPGTETRGPIRLHKTLAWIHGPGMILTPILGAIAFDQRSRGEKVHGIASAHGAVAIVTASAYAAAILSVSIKF